MIKEEQEAMAKQMPSTFWGAATAMLGGPPPPPGAEGQGSQSAPAPTSAAPEAK